MTDSALDTAEDKPELTADWTLEAADGTWEVIEEILELITDSTLDA
jgi:hypothetical protein